jgi:hypothetical protein
MPEINFTIDEQTGEMEIKVEGVQGPQCADVAKIVTELTGAPEHEENTNEFYARTNVNGTGSADSETGIKKAEHDALKRAAVKFGVARDLYRDEDGTNESSKRTGNYAQAAPPRDPIARNLASLITPSQLALINKLAKRLKLDPEVACQEMYKANLNEISRRAASALIEHLNATLQDQ